MALIEVKIPAVAESITEVTLASWMVKDGDFVERDAVLCEVETDKASQELYAEESGTVKLIANEGDDIAVGALICTIDTAATGNAGATSKPAEKAAAAPIVEKSVSKVSITPVAENIAIDKGIKVDQIKGTGEGGKITKNDVIKASSTPETTVPLAAKADVPASLQRREKMSRLRKTIAKRLVAVKNETAMLTTFNEVDMKPIMDIRSKYKESFEKKHGIGLGFMSFFVKAVCLALKDFPAVNAYIDGEDIVYNDFCDISIAVSAPQGLVVPVVRNADNLQLDEIEKAIKALAVKARDNKLSMDEMTGGTFSITNGGVFGSMLSTPIINPPQSAILGMHNIVERAVVKNGEIVIRPIMYVAMSYDHLIIDGKESVSFLFKVKEYLEDPQRMLLLV